MTLPSDISFWSDFSDLVARKGKDIAVFIAEWRQAQKIKEARKTPEDIVGRYSFDPETELLDSTITIETILRVVSIEPLKLEEDHTRMVITRLSGGKHVIRVEDKKLNGKQAVSLARQKAKAEIIEVVAPNKGCCNTCFHETYDKLRLDSDSDQEVILNHRDCTNLSEWAQDYFDKNVKIKMGRSEIRPAQNCSFWKMKKKEAEVEQS